jgi:hypothetical protein
LLEAEYIIDGAQINEHAAALFCFRKLQQTDLGKPNLFWRRDTIIFAESSLSQRALVKM